MISDPSIISDEPWTGPGSPPAVHVEYSYEPLRQELLDTAAEFAGALQSEKIGRAFGRNLPDEARQVERRVQQRLDAPFTLVVVGDFKRGKSTLINALLGRAVVTTDVTPETVTINRIEYGERFETAAVLEDGGVVRFSPEELKRERLESVLARLPKKAKLLSLKAPNPLLEDLALVDTPGLGDVLERFKDQVCAYLQQCDALVYVISALSPLSESEQGFLRIAVLPQEFPKMIVVVNMVDVLGSEEDERRVVESIRAKLHRLFPAASLLPVSSLDEFCRRCGATRPNPARADALAARFDRLRRRLEESVLVHRRFISLERATRLFETVVRTVEQRTDLLRDAVHSNEAALSRAIEECQQRSSSLHRAFEEQKCRFLKGINDLAVQAETWIGEFVSRLESEVAPSLESYSYDEVTKHFHFFLVESLQTALRQCLAAHQEEISELAAKTREGMAQNLSRLAAVRIESLCVAQPTFRNLPWKGADLFLFTADVLVGGFFLNLLFGFLHEKRAEGRVAQFAERFRDSLPRLRQDLHDEVRATYSRLGSEIMAEIEKAHEQDLHACLDALSQARQAHAQGSDAIRQTGDAIAEVTAHLDRIRSFLPAFRERLSASIAESLPEPSVPVSLSIS